MSSRFAVAVALIAGLLGMHGFSSNHGSMPLPATDGGMAAHGAAAGEAAAGAAMAMPLKADELSVGATAARDVTAAGAAAASAATPMASLTDGSGHAMGALCLAILTGLGWLLLALLLGRRGRTLRPAARYLHAAQARAAEPVPPSLSELCVLRT